MAIPCNELQQNINYLISTFEACKPIKGDDMKLLLDLMVSLNSCSEGGGGGIPTDHNLLLGLQPLDNEDYYHLTEEQYNYIASLVVNDDIQDIKDKLNLLATPPTYVRPTSSINNITGTYEVGSTVDINLTQTFNQNDGGIITNRNIIKDATVVANNVDTFSESLVVPFGSTSYSGNINFAEGPCKTNNIGLEDCTGKILAGITTSPSRIITGAFRTYFGGVSTFPTTGAGIRTALISTSILNANNNFSFTTGTTNRRFIIAIPNNKTLVSVTNIGTNEILTFTLDSTITVLPAGGVIEQLYKVYKLENAVPFSNNYTLNVITN